MLDDPNLADLLQGKVGISRTFAYELAHRKSLPSLVMAVRIERVLGIPPAAWVDAAKPQHDGA